MTYNRKMLLMIIIVLLTSPIFGQELDARNDLNHLLGSDNYKYKIDKTNSVFIVSIYPIYKVQLNGDVITTVVDKNYIDSLKILLESKYPETKFKIIPFNRLPKEFENQLSRREKIKNFLLVFLIIILSLFILLLVVGLYKNRKRLKEIEDLVFKSNDMIESLQSYVKNTKTDFIIIHISNSNFQKICKTYNPEILYENRILFFYNYLFEYKSMLLATSFSKKMVHNNIVKINYIKYSNKVNKK